jgi:hypothetical protein
VSCDFSHHANGGDNDQQEKRAVGKIKGLVEVP